MDKFSGKQVYRIAYGASEDKCTLFACNFKSITMFPDSNVQNKSSDYGNNESYSKHINFFNLFNRNIHSYMFFFSEFKQFSTGITSISTCENYLSIGTTDGIFKIQTLNFEVSPFLRRQLTIIC